MPDQFSCDACGRKYTWKPELAGKRVKCKCGQVLSVPKSVAAPPPLPAADPDEIPLYEDEAEQAAREGVCPGCGAQLPRGAVLCVQCGYNLKTGKKVTVAAATPVAAAVSAPTGGKATRATAAPASATASGAYAYGTRPIRRGNDEEESKGSTKLYITLGAVVLLVAVLGGGWFIYQGTGGADANVPRVGEDAKVEEMIDDEGATDAREWLKVRQRVLMGMTNPQSVDFVERLYAKGATRVFAFGGGVICMSIGIELPQDPNARKELFAWQAQWHSDMFEKVATDVGQKYLLIRMKV